MRASLICLLIAILNNQIPAQSARPSPPILHDIRIQMDEKLIAFRNSRIALEFSRETGQWLALRDVQLDQNLIAPAATSIDYRVDGQWTIQKNGVKLLSHDVAIDPSHDGASLRLHLRCGEDELICAYKLRPNEASLDRSATLIRAQAGRMEGFLFMLPGILIGDSSDCTLQAPGPFWPGRFIHAGTKYDDWKGKQADFHSAPDAGFGILGLSNAKLNMTVASWMETGGEVAYQSNLAGDGSRITFRHTDLRAYRLQPRTSIQSDIHHIEIVRGPMREALLAFRRMAERTMPLAANPPAWTRDPIILEVYPRYYKGGFAEIAQRLPSYREVGFNVLYLMPHWKGGYSPIDLYEVDPAYGTKEDLQRLVKAAHELGMKVIFDMVIHGFNEKSPVVQQRPDLFCRDEKGQLARHPAWKSITTDWASPAYRQYMVDLVLHDLKTYDIDGYRVDAQTFKGANWDPELPYPAYRSGSASHELIGVMLSGMRKHKPDAAMLSEVFGPLFYTVCDMVHDNQTEAPQYFLEQLEKGELSAADYKSHLSAVYDALPRGATRVMFARNHDTSWFYHFNGYKPDFMALDAIHALFGSPEVFAGDPRNGPSPDADPATFAYYRKIFALRKQFPELARGEVLLREAKCDNRMVVTGLRRLPTGTVLAVVSLSDKPAEAQITLPDVQLRGSIEMLDPIAGCVTRSTAAENRLSLKLAPFQVLVGRITSATDAR